MQLKYRPSEATDIANLRPRAFVCLRQACGSNRAEYRCNGTHRSAHRTCTHPTEPARGLLNLPSNLPDQDGNEASTSPAKPPAPSSTTLYQTRRDKETEFPTSWPVGEIDSSIASAPRMNRVRYRVYETQHCAWKPMRSARQPSLRNRSNRSQGH